MMKLTPKEQEIIRLIRSFESAQTSGELVIRFDPKGSPVKAEPKFVHKLSEH